MPLERVVRITASGPQPRAPRGARTDAVLRVARRLWLRSDAPCLERSLAVHRQLGLAGERPELVLGLADDHLGHAWVELDGQALLEAAPPQNRYSELMRFDAAGDLMRDGD
jgi:hypothetical protein